MFKKYRLKRYIRKRIKSNIHIHEKGVIEFGGIVAGFKDFYKEETATIRTKNYGIMSFDEAMKFLSDFCEGLYRVSDQLRYVDQIAEMLINDFPTKTPRYFYNVVNFNPFIENRYDRIKREEMKKINSTREHILDKIKNLPDIENEKSS